MHVCSIATYLLVNLAIIKECKIDMISSVTSHDDEITVSVTSHPSLVMV